MTHIKYIYFDLGGVLIHIQTVIDDLAALSKKTSQEFNDMFEEFNNHAARGIITSDQLWKEYQEKLFTKPTQYASYVDFCAERFDVIQPTFDCMIKLSQQYPIGIISNIEQGIFELLKKKHLLPPVSFTNVICSCDIGYAKPEPEIYAIAEEKATVDPQSILFIDDREVNLEIPRLRGWRTVLFDTKNPEISLQEVTSLLSL